MHSNAASLDVWFRFPSCSRRDGQLRSTRRRSHLREFHLNERCFGDVV